MSAPVSQRGKGLFDDLGKPTLRGVRKCPKCGTYNGTRGFSCKNKNCDAVFKESGDKRKHSTNDAVKIITGNPEQVYSVRIRDRGLENRGFVQLPLLQELDSLQEQADETEIISQATARCYVDACQKPDNGLDTINISTCQHIRAALGCDTEAQPLTLKNSVLNALPISSEFKQAIWLLATETTGPLVQRVSKHVMVVKCKSNPRHPLGFLHFSFMEVTRKRVNPEYRFQCTCRAFKNFKLSLAKDEAQKRCVHFYACICAFASDEKLSKEFAFFINMGDVNTSPEHKLVAIFSNPEENQQACKIEIDVSPDTVAFLAAAASDVSVTSVEEPKAAKKQKKEEPKIEDTEMGISTNTVKVEHSDVISASTDFTTSFGEENKMFSQQKQVAGNYTMQMIRKLHDEELNPMRREQEEHMQCIIEEEEISMAEKKQRQRMKKEIHDFQMACLKEQHHMKMQILNLKKLFQENLNRMQKC